MAILDFSHLSPEQEAELDLRIARLSEDLKDAIDAETVEADLDSRYG